MSAALMQIQSKDELDLVVVDDNDLTLEIVTWILRASDTRFSVYNDPVEALKALSQCMPRILITDFFMPVIDGLDFLTQSRAMPGAEHCEIFLCSAVELAPDQARQLELVKGRLLSKSDLCEKHALLEIVQGSSLGVNR